MVSQQGAQRVMPDRLAKEQIRGEEEENPTVPGRESRIGEAITSLPQPVGVRSSLGMRANDHREFPTHVVSSHKFCRDLTGLPRGIV